MGLHLNPAITMDQQTTGLLELQNTILQGWNRLANAKIEERLTRLWAKKQQEKEDRFAKLRKQHEKELKLLANRSQKKVENIFRGVSKGKIDTEEILKYEYASAPTKVNHRFIKDISFRLEFPFLVFYCLLGKTIEPTDWPD